MTKRGKRVAYKPGDYVAVPLADLGGYGYARVPATLMAFYDVRTDDLAKIEQISLAPIMFSATVSDWAIRAGRWPVIGFSPLEDDLRKEVKFFRRNPNGNGFLIYVSIPDPPSAYREYEAEAIDCVGLEPLFAWTPESIEQRLSDHFAGKKNVAVEYAVQYLAVELSRSRNFKH
jgi:hypothetical protein